MSMYNANFTAMLLCLSSSHICQRDACLLVSREPSDRARGFSPFQTTVMNYSWLIKLPVSVSNNTCFKKKATRNENFHFHLSISMPRRSAPSSSSARVFTFRRQTEPETLEISQAAEVFQTTLQVLKNRARQRHKRGVTAAGRIAFFH